MTTYHECRSHGKSEAEPVVVSYTLGSYRPKSDRRFPANTSLTLRDKTMTFRDYTQAAFRLREFRLDQQQLLFLLQPLKYKIP